MNRFKKELIKRGYKIATAPNCEPYVAQYGDTDILVNTSLVTLSTYTNYTITHLAFDKNMNTTRTFMLR